MMNSEHVHVAMCDCGNTWTVDPHSDRNRGCWSCHRALWTDDIQVFEFAKQNDVTDQYGREDG